jgi:hypothetical protein
MSSHDNAAAEELILEVYRRESPALVGRGEPFEYYAPVVVKFL